MNIKNIQKFMPFSKIKIKPEYTLAIILAVVCSLAGTSNLLFASNDLFPYTSDAMGHMAKIKYIAECLSQGNLPSWFPYWYNGSTVTQYYVPLSYYILAPIYWLVKNIMLTFKINCILMMFIGGMGVWTFCYKKIGKWCGLFGILAFCLQPFLLESLYAAGVLAQGPIFALMPWFLLIILSCAKSPTRLNTAICVALEVLLILSHAMHAFMVCLCTMIVLLILVFLKKIKFKNYIITLCTISFAGLITAFWSLVGATHLENPGIPYLLPESSLNYTARLSWFTMSPSSVFHYSLTISILCIVAIILYTFSQFKKHTSENHKYYIPSVILITIFTTIFSFGMYLPFFKYLPMATSLVPGRILSYTAVTGAISSAYVFSILLNAKKYIILRISAVLALASVLLVTMNPYNYTFETRSSDNFDSLVKYMDTESNAFDKGRYSWLGAIDSSETYYPLQHKFNISDGWNIEGSPHNHAIWNYNIALSTGAYDYIAKQLAFWNVRYLLLYRDYTGITNTLYENLGFRKLPVERKQFSFYSSNKPSSYFLTDSRNSIVIGDSSSVFTIAFPYLIQGKSAKITDYSYEELSKYRLVYLYENEINTEKELSYLESIVTQLVNSGVKVIIQPKETENFNIFGTYATDEKLESTPTFELNKNCPWKIDNKIDLDSNGRIRSFRSLHGLDKTYAAFVQQKNDNIKNCILGTKSVGNGEVIFIGGSLNNYLLPVFTNALGIASVDRKIITTSINVEEIFKSIYSSLSVNKNYLPEAYKVTTSSWDYKGGFFSYNNTNTQKVTISVTYSPRWTAKLDGKEIKIGQHEKLITLELPSGYHNVELHYGITLYGKLGYLISLGGLILVILFLIYLYRIQAFLNQKATSFRRYIQY